MQARRQAPSVMLVDDDRLFRSRIAELIVESELEAFVAEADSAEACIARLQERRWDAIIIDIRMPGADGFALLGAIRRTDRDVPVIMMSGLPEAQYGRPARRAGACAYVHKDAAADSLVATLTASLQEKSR